MGLCWLNQYSYRYQEHEIAAVLIAIQPSLIFFTSMWSVYWFGKLSIRLLSCVLGTDNYNGSTNTQPIWRIMEPCLLLVLITWHYNLKSCFTLWLNDWNFIAFVNKKGVPVSYLLLLRKIASQISLKFLRYRQKHFITMPLLM